MQHIETDAGARIDSESSQQSQSDLSKSMQKSQFEHCHHIEFLPKLTCILCCSDGASYETHSSYYSAAL